MTEPTRTSQRASSQNGPGLGFAVANPKGDRVVYLGNDPSLNSLTLTITNQTGKALPLKGGAPVPEEQIDSTGPSSLYLTPGDLLSADQFTALQVSAPGWHAIF